MGAAGAAFWVQTLGNKAFIEVKPKIRGKIRRCALGNKETLKKKKIKTTAALAFFQQKYNKAVDCRARHPRGTHCRVFQTTTYSKKDYVK